jgi:hypothetical protein
LEESAPIVFLSILTRYIDTSSNPKQNGYNAASFWQMELVFQKLSQTFLIMRTHVISIVVGDNSHFICFLVVNFGAHFKEGSAADREPSFIANRDSLHCQP